MSGVSVDPPQSVRESVAPTPTPAPLAAVLGYEFARPQLLDKALTHASLGERGSAAQAHEFERMEFLGDRVLALVVADLLVRRFAQEREGELARRLAALVSREALATVARRIELGRYLRLSRGEDDSGGRDNPGVLADALEAVIAALYQDGGLTVARRFIEREWMPLVDSADGPPRDPKTALQEWAQARGRPLPTYRTVAADGPPHRPVFTVAVTVEGEEEAVASGSSKRVAERAAAEQLLNHLERDRQADD